MSNKTTITLYDALQEMRAISEEGGTFSLRHRKYDRQRNIGGDLAIIPAARMRPQAKDEQIRDAHRKLFYVDTETGEAKVCWHCLIMEFNGKRVII